MRDVAGVATWRWLALLVAVVLLVIALLTAGSTTPAVANVDGHAVTLTVYRQWLQAAAASAHASDSELPSFVPDAPNYSRCVAFEAKAATKGGSKAPSTATLRADCGEIRTDLAETVMQLLISGQWFLDEGAREHLTVSSSQLQKALRSSTKSTSLPQILGKAGLSQADLAFEAEAGLMAGQLSARHSGPTPTITSAQIASYYNENRSAIGNETLAKATPAIREVLVEEAQAPTYNAWLATVQRRFQPLTTCAPGYRIADYCRVES